MEWHMKSVVCLDDSYTPSVGALNSPKWMSWPPPPAPLNSTPFTRQPRNEGQGAWVGGADAMLGTGALNEACGEWRRRARGGNHVWIA